MIKSQDLSAEKFFENFNNTVSIVFDTEAKVSGPERPLVTNLIKNFDKVFEYKEQYERETLSDTLVLIDSQNMTQNRSSHKNMASVFQLQNNVDNEDKFALKKIPSPPALTKEGEYFTRNDGSIRKDIRPRSNNVLRFPFDDITNYDDRCNAKTSRIKIKKFNNSNSNNTKHLNDDSVSMREQLLNSFKNEKFVVVDNGLNVTGSNTRHLKLNNSEACRSTYFLSPSVQSLPSGQRKTFEIIHKSSSYLTIKGDRNNSQNNLKTEGPILKEEYKENFDVTKEKQHMKLRDKSVENEVKEKHDASQKSMNFLEREANKIKELSNKKNNNPPRKFSDHTNIEAFNTKISHIREGDSIRNYKSLKFSILLGSKASDTKKSKHINNSEFLQSKGYTSTGMDDNKSYSRLKVSPKEYPNMTNIVDTTNNGDLTQKMSHNRRTKKRSILYEMPFTTSSRNNIKALQNKSTNKDQKYFLSNELLIENDKYLKNTVSKQISKFVCESTLNSPNSNKSRSISNINSLNNTKNICYREGSPKVSEFKDVTEFNEIKKTSKSIHQNSIGSQTKIFKGIELKMKGKNDTANIGSQQTSPKSNKSNEGFKAYNLLKPNAANKNEKAPEIASSNDVINIINNVNFIDNLNIFENIKANQKHKGNKTAKFDNQKLALDIEECNRNNVDAITSQGSMKNKNKKNIVTNNKSSYLFCFNSRTSLNTIKENKKTKDNQKVFYLENKRQSHNNLNNNSKKVENEQVIKSNLGPNFFNEQNNEVKDKNIFGFKKSKLASKISNIEEQYENEPNNICSSKINTTKSSKSLKFVKNLSPKTQNQSKLTSKNKSIIFNNNETKPLMDFIQFKKKSIAFQDNSQKVASIQNKKDVHNTCNPQFFLNSNSRTSLSNSNRKKYNKINYDKQKGIRNLLKHQKSQAKLKDHLKVKDDFIQELKIRISDNLDAKNEALSTQNRAFGSFTEKNMYLHTHKNSSANTSNLILNSTKNAIENKSIKDNKRTSNNLLNHTTLNDMSSSIIKFRKSSLKGNNPGSQKGQLTCKNVTSMFNKKGSQAETKSQNYLNLYPKNVVSNLNKEASESSKVTKVLNCTAAELFSRGKQAQLMKKKGLNSRKKLSTDKSSNNN